MKAVLIFILMLASYTVTAQHLKFKIEGQPDTTIYLVKYFGKKLFYADTARIENGIVEFDGSKQKPGILALYIPGQNILEFVYNEEPETFIEARGPNFMNTAKVYESEENKIFMDYVRFISENKQEAGRKTTLRDGKEKGNEQYEDLTKQINAINEEIRSYRATVGKSNWDETFLGEQEAKVAKLEAKRQKADPESKKYAKLTSKMDAINEKTKAYKEKAIDENLDPNVMGPKETKLNQLTIQRDGHPKGSDMYKQLTDEIQKINEGVEEHQKEIAEKYKNLLVGKIINMSIDIEVPDPPKDAKGNIIDSSFSYNYFKKHYFDNIDLTDDRLVRTPVFDNKFSYYFSDKMMLQHWDTVTNNAFEFIDRLDPKSDMFQYCVSSLTSKYEKSKIMGLNTVFVKLGKKYYCTPNAEGKSPAHWMPVENLDKLCEKVNTHINLVMGVTPPELVLKDTSDTKWISFMDLDAEYTLLYFWDPQCGHCKKITPKLQTLYNKKWKDRNIEIYAIGKAVGEDFDKWKAFIRKHNLEFINVAVTDQVYKDATDPADVNKMKLREMLRHTNLQSLNYQQTYDIYATPKVWVLDKDKKIIAYSLTVSQLEDMLDRLQKKTDAEKLFPPEENPDDEQM